MANHKKATHHHGKAGDALKKGDHKGAAHHMGHALAALRMGATDDDAMDSGGDMAEETADVVPAKQSIRDRLRGFGKK